MRKVIFQNMVSLDGYFEGPNHEIDWHNVDSEFNDYAIDFLNNIDTLIFGRKTYELMASYWPTKDSAADDPIVAEKMNSLQKIVFSRTLPYVQWQNSRLIKEDASKEVDALKHQEGKGIAIFGSSNLALTLIPQKLIDEFRIIVNPVFLGDGNPLLKGMQRQQLRLIKTQTFHSGNAMLIYEPIK